MGLEISCCLDFNSLLLVLYMIVVQVSPRSATKAYILCSFTYISSRVKVNYELGRFVTCKEDQPCTVWFLTLNNFQKMNEKKKKKKCEINQRIKSALEAKF